MNSPVGAQIKCFYGIKFEYNIFRVAWTCFVIVNTILNAGGY